MQDLYHEQLLEEAKKKRNYGELEDADEEATSFNSACGDTMTVRVKFSKDQALIDKLQWIGTGCIISQAAMSALSEELVGRKTAEVKEMGMAEVLELLKLKNIAPGRLRCLLLGLSTVKKALPE